MEGRDNDPALLLFERDMITAYESRVTCCACFGGRRT